MAVNKQQFIKKLGATISRYRQQIGLTQEQLAEKLGMGNEAISRIERGVSMPALIRLIEFANIFECNVSDLLMGSSLREQDSAEYIQTLLAQISDEDRDFLITMIEKWVSHLAHK